MVFLVLTGIALAACGHVLLHDLLGAAAGWTRLDERFPPEWRSTPSFAGAFLLAIGAMFVLSAIVAAA